jgi:hypothetical protein
MTIMTWGNAHGARRDGKSREAGYHAGASVMQWSDKHGRREHMPNVTDGVCERVVQP